MRRPTTAIVTSGDSNYFPIVAELVHSIRRFRENDDKDICVMDTGFADHQIEYLKNQGCSVVAPDWPCDIPQRKIRGREYLKSCVCRPFIPTLFPDYETYIWLDADTWVQDNAAIDLLYRGAQKQAVAISPQADRNYGKAMRVKWFGPFVTKARSFYYSNARKAFSGDVARRLFPYTTLNVGVFAMRGDAPHWQAWQDLIVRALKKGKVFTAEQLTLGMLVYLESYRAEFLPAWCNWLCERKPHFHAGLFVEPSLPHTPIGIMHLSGYDEMRINREAVTQIDEESGKPDYISLRYPLFDGETLSDVQPNGAASIGV